MSRATRLHIDSTFNFFPASNILENPAIRTFSLNLENPTRHDEPVLLAQHLLRFGLAAADPSVGLLKMFYEVLVDETLCFTISGTSDTLCVSHRTSEW